MPTITLRNQRLSDAKRYSEILNDPKFIYFPVKPTIEEERNYLKDKKKREAIGHINFAIEYKGELVGSCGIKLDPHRTHIAEIGYFVASEFWGKGIATQQSN